LLRMSRGGYVEILGTPSDHQVAHAATDEVSEVARIYQAIENLDDVGVDVAARDRMVSAFDYARFQLMLRGPASNVPSTCPTVTAKNLAR